MQNPADPQEIAHDGWAVDPARQKFPRTESLPPELQADFSRDIAGYLAQLRDEDVQVVIDRSVAERVRTMHLAPLIGKVLSVMTEDGRHQETF